MQHVELNTNSHIPERAIINSWKTEQVDSGLIQPKFSSGIHGHCTLSEAISKI